MNEEGCGIRAELWEEYRALQRKADRARLDSYSWALEERLNYFLDAIDGALPRNLEIRSKSLHNLVLNRTKKHSRRARLLEEQYGVSTAEPSPEDVAVQQLYLRERIAIVRGAASETDWRILWSLAEEKDYCTVAKHEGMSISALKARVCRCRRRLGTIAA